MDEVSGLQFNAVHQPKNNSFQALVKKWKVRASRQTSRGIPLISTKTINTPAPYHLFMLDPCMVSCLLFPFFPEGLFAFDPLLPALPPHVGW